jgi:hypothetical protein
VVTICSRQSAGAERLQSTAMILITIEAPCRRGRYWLPWRNDLPVPCPAGRGSDYPAGRYCRISREPPELGGLARAQTSRQIEQFQPCLGPTTAR